MHSSPNSTWRRTLISHFGRWVVTAKFVNKHRTLSCLDLCVIQLNELQGCKWMSGILLQSVFHSGAVNHNLFLTQWRELQSVFHSVAVNYNLFLTQWRELQSVFHWVAVNYNLSFTGWQSITICFWLSDGNYNLSFTQWYYITIYLWESYIVYMDLT